MKNRMIKTRRIKLKIIENEDIVMVITMVIITITAIIIMTITIIIMMIMRVKIGNSIKI